MLSIIVVGAVLIVVFLVVAGRGQETSSRNRDTGASGYASTDGGYSDTSAHDKSHDSNDDGGSTDSGGSDSGGGDSGGGGDGGGGD